MAFLQRERPQAVPGVMGGADMKLGHILREGGAPAASSESRAGIVIVGGGVAGLCAGWELRRRGFGDMVMLEMGRAPGGNSLSGRNATSAYPWGAHYVPMPGPEAVFTRELFEELGVITGYGASGLPIYNEYHICAYPQERLLVNGQWQEGFIPHLGASKEDIGEFDRFFSAMEEFKRAKGADGKRAFVIPVDESSRDERFIRLDDVSMARFMEQNGWKSKRLLWHVDYCCRDDYGAGMNETSAWAGIHYFASRNGEAANAEPANALTWPEGNGWITARLAGMLGGPVKLNALVTSVAPSGSGAIVDYYDAVTKKSRRIHADAVIFAAPRFVAARVVKGLGQNTGAIAYSPWMVANITLASAPGGHGAPLAWDNVKYGSRSLGYVVATHQALASHPRETVITMYFPLDGQSPASSRKEAAARTVDQWKQMALKELCVMHPGMDQQVKNVDVWVWGHAMVRPAPGFMWGANGRLAMPRSIGGVFFAHSDMSGISIFEEAQYRGVTSAREALKRVRA
jgi:hypothetical protein